MRRGNNQQLHRIKKRRRSRIEDFLNYATTILFFYLLNLKVFHITQNETSKMVKNCLSQLTSSHIFSLNTSSANWTASLTVPLCIFLDLTELQNMTSIKRFPQATSTPKIYPMALLIFHIVENSVLLMTNASYRNSSSVFSELQSIGDPKPNQDLRLIQQTSRLELSTWPPKWSNCSNPSYKILDSKSPMIQLPYMSTVTYN